MKMQVFIFRIRNCISRKWPCSTNSLPHLVLVSKCFFLFIFFFYLYLFIFSLYLSLYFILCLTASSLTSCFFRGCPSHHLPETKPNTSQAQRSAGRHILSLQSQTGCCQRRLASRGGHAATSRA